MTTSGTYNWSLANSDVLIEAFERCQIEPTSLTRNQLISARRSLNLEMQSWSLRGVNLWKLDPFTVQLVAGQAVYTTGTGLDEIPNGVMQMLDVFYSTINGGGAGINTDRIMLPMGHTDYAQFTNKLEPGQPTMYWFQKLESPTLTVYQPSLVGYPTAQLGGYYLSRIQDAGMGSGENPDVVYRALDALCAGVATRIAQKRVKDPQLRKEIKEAAIEAWDLFDADDREDAPITILPASNYFRMD